MKIHNVTQGSDAWLDLRNNCFTASEAPAMMGCGWVSREELLFQKKTGITPEIDEKTQALFDKGHAAEASARPGIESEIGETLYPATATHDDYAWMLSSFDGITMMEDTVWEHKLWNEKLAELVRLSRETGECQLTGKHFWQLEQQLLVSGAEKVVFTVSDGTEERKESFEYFPVHGRAEELMAGWAQFRADLEVYQPPESKNLPTANVISDLPVVTYRREGMSIMSDFDKFKRQASRLIERAKKPMVTDQDFADGKQIAKIFSKAEKLLDGVVDRINAEVPDIDAFRRGVLEAKEEIIRARIDVDKRYNNELKSRKAAIQNDASREVAMYVAELESSLSGIRIPHINDGIVQATKGKRTIDTFQQAANDAVATAKIAYKQQADIAAANLKTLGASSEYRFLFNDIAQIAFKPSNDFANLVNARISEHKAKEEARIQAEREYIRQEEEAKAMAEAERQMRIQAEQEAKKASEQIVAEPMQAMPTNQAPAQPLAKIAEHAAVTQKKRVQVTISEEMFSRLKKLASEECWDDEIQSGETIVDDFAGGNIDEAYSGGFSSGEVSIAREILEDAGIAFKQKEEALF